MYSDLEESEEELNSCSICLEQDINNYYKLCRLCQRECCLSCVAVTGSKTNLALCDQCWIPRCALCSEEIDYNIIGQPPKPLLNDQPKHFRYLYCPECYQQELDELKKIKQYCEQLNKNN